jgi:hypothetical protein
MQLTTSILLSRMNVKHAIEKWFNKKYSRYYYGIRLRKNEIDKFLNILPLRNEEKKKRINTRFFQK